MPEITIDYMVPVSVRVDVETGETRSISLAGESFQFGDPKLTQIFTCNAVVDGEELDEYIPHEHPVAVKALEIAGNLRLAATEMILPFVVTDADGKVDGAATYGVGGSEGAEQFARMADQALDRLNAAENLERKAIAAARADAEERELEARAATPIETPTRKRPSGLAGADTA